MGLLFFLGLNALIVVALVGVVRKPRDLAGLLRAFMAHPLILIYQFVFIGSCLLAGWGILSMGYLSWPIQTPWGTIQSWQLAGLVAIGCLAIGFLYSVYENDFKRR